MSDNEPLAQASRTRALEHYVGISKDSHSQSWGVLEARFDKHVYNPLVAELLIELVVAMVHEAAAEHVKSLESATHEELEAVARDIGIGVLEAYDELAKRIAEAGGRDD